jgi:hypothetical protein
VVVFSLATIFQAGHEGLTVVNTLAWKFNTTVKCLEDRSCCRHLFIILKMTINHRYLREVD